MAVYVFQSITDPELYSFAPDATGATLPVETGPWAAARDVVPLGITMAAQSPQIDRQIETNGYALVESRGAQPELPVSESKP